MPVDLHVGGAQYAVLHLLYARFWHKVLFDLGLVHTKEPFQKLLNPGMVLGYSYRYFDDNTSDDPDAEPNSYPASETRPAEESVVHVESGVALKARWVRAEDVRWSEDGVPMHPSVDGLALEEVTEKMSKSRGNVVNPDDVIAEYGTDAMRLYEMFMGPLDKGAPWSTESIPGVFRFLQRAHRLLLVETDTGDVLRDLPEGSGTEAQARLLAKTIEGVTEDLEQMQFNTAISKLMVFARDISKDAPLPHEAATAFALMLSPLAPHLADELWQHLGHSTSLAHEPWPVADAEWLADESITLAVQVNGRRRAEIQVPAGADDDAIREFALGEPNVARHLEGRPPKKVIVVPGRLVNIVG
jgi:leucyl-tRNA synthetase